MILYHGLTAAQSESLVSKIVEKNVQLLIDRVLFGLGVRFCFHIQNKGIRIAECA